MVNVVNIRLIAFTLKEVSDIHFRIGRPERKISCSREVLAEDQSATALQRLLGKCGVYIIISCAEV